MYGTEGHSLRRQEFLQMALRHTCPSRNLITAALLGVGQAAAHRDNEAMSEDAASLVWAEYTKGACWEGAHRHSLATTLVRVKPKYSHCTFGRKLCM